MRCNDQLLIFVIITQALQRSLQGVLNSGQYGHYNTQDDTNSMRLMMQHASHTKSFMRQIYEGDGTSPRP